MESATDRLLREMTAELGEQAKLIDDQAALIEILVFNLEESIKLLSKAYMTLDEANKCSALWERAYRAEQARNAAASDSPPPITIPYTKH